MRDKNRLDGFYKRVCNIHKRYFPDWRFGQLVSNLTRWIWNETEVDIFNLEDDAIVLYFKDFAVKNGNNNDGMTLKEAARLINPNTCTEALEEYKRLGEECDVKAMREACELACKALKFMDDYNTE